MEEAAARNHNYVTPEHLFLGLLRDRQNTASIALTNLGVNLDKAAEDVVAFLATKETRGS